MEKVQGKISQEEIDQQCRKHEENLRLLRKSFDLDKKVRVRDLMTGGEDMYNEEDFISSYITVEIYNELLRRITLMISRDQQVFAPMDRDFLLSCIKDFTKGILMTTGFGPCGWLGEYHKKKWIIEDGEIKVISAE